MPNGRNSSRPKLTGQELRKAKNRINIINGKMQVLILWTLGRKGNGTRLKKLRRPKLARWLRLKKTMPLTPFQLPQLKLSKTKKLKLRMSFYLTATGRDSMLWIQSHQVRIISKNYWTAKETKNCVQTIRKSSRNSKRNRSLKKRIRSHLSLKRSPRRRKFRH